MDQVQFELTIEESAFNVWHYIINPVVNQSRSCAAHVELVFHKVGQSLFQTGELQSVVILLQRGASIHTK